MPELAALYAMGFVANWIFAGFVIWREARIESSAPMSQLQLNLKKLNLRFVNAHDVISPREGEKPASQVRTLMFLAIFCSSLSWLGFLFQLIVVVSLEKLAHKERKILFETDIARKSLEPSKIQSILATESESFRMLNKTSNSL